MSEFIVEDGVRYRELDFLGFPDYRVGDDGSVWTKHKPPTRPLKFSDDEVEQIRGRYAHGEGSQENLAAEFGCGVATMNNLLRGFTYRDGVVTWRRLKTKKKQRSGYLSVCLYRDGEPGRGHHVAVHRLVLLAFVGPKPPGTEARHFPDRDVENNRTENLSWAAHSINVVDRTTHGTERRGSRHNMAKLDESDVIDMRRLRRAGWSLTSLAVKFNVTAGHVGRVVTYRLWRHLP